MKNGQINLAESSFSRLTSFSSQTSVKKSNFFSDVIQPAAAAAAAASQTCVRDLALVLQSRVTLGDQTWSSYPGLKHHPH